MFPLADKPETLPNRADVVVVGSGYGGAITALRYAEAGFRVVVLERGREILTGQFPTKLPELRRELQMTGASMSLGKPTGLFDFRLGDDLHVLQGCGLGGGSLINAGVALQADPRVFQAEPWPEPIAEDGRLTAGYARSASYLRPARDPLAHEARKFQSLGEAAPALGHAADVADVAVSFSDTVNPAGVAQAACTRCGDCCAGCNVGAKNTLAMTYLPAAKAAGARLFTCVAVDTVAPDAGTGHWTVRFRNVGDAPAQSPAGPESGVIRAERVVLAAGSLGSSAILLRSRAEASLAVSDKLGERFSANGDIIAFGYGARDPVGSIGVGADGMPGVPMPGAAVTGQIPVRDPEDLASEMYVQEGVLPSALAGVLPVFFVPNGRIFGAAASLIKGVYGGPLSRLQTFFVVSHDSASGRIVWDGDRVRIDWPGCEDEPVHERVDGALKAIITAAGGDYVKSPLAVTSVGAKPATAHPLGGVGMGRNRSDGVVDHAGRVFDASPGRSVDAVHQGLTVVDGSTIPTSLGCNPLWTISALAERAAEIALPE